jgi:hypothetical protein
MLKLSSLNTGRIIKEEHLKWRLLALQAALSQELFFACASLSREKQFYRSMSF